MPDLEFPKKLVKKYFRSWKLLNHTLVILALFSNFWLIQKDCKNYWLPKWFSVRDVPLILQKIIQESHTVKMCFQLYSHQNHTRFVRAGNPKESKRFHKES